jgi:hypothetical protein
MENLDILQILQTGLPGLVFLLSVLSYRLLSQEQGKEKPNEKLLNSICRFMYINVFLAVLTMSSPILESYLTKLDSDGSLVKNSFETEVSSGFDTLKPQTAAVCIASQYAGLYMLLLEKDTQKLMQVQATPIIPCESDNDSNKVIRLSKNDMQEWVGDAIDVNSVVATISVAPKGYQFPFIN